MQQHLQKINNFLISKFCIFKYTKLDYPTLFQQKMITSYFQYTTLLSKQYDQLIRVLHTINNDKYLQNIICGILYNILLNSKTPQLSLQHLKTLKSQAWEFLLQIFQQVLVQSFQDLKIQNRFGLAIVYAQLSYFYTLKNNITIMMIKTIDCYNLSPTNLSYILYVIDTIQHILEKQEKSVQRNNQILIQQSSNSNSQNIKILSQFLFFKMLRLNTIIFMFEDKGMKQFQQKCLKITIKLWQKNKKICILYGNQLSRYTQQLNQIQSFNLLCKNIQEQLSRFQGKINWSMRQVAVSSLLPIKVQTSLIFIIRQRISQNCIKQQIKWVWQNQLKQKQKGEHLYMLLIDMTRWIVITNANIQQKIYILQQLLKICKQKNDFYELFKQALFLDWFQQQSTFQMLYTSLNFLGYTFSREFRTGQNLISYILTHKNNQFFYHKIKSILLQANKQGFLKLSMYIQNNFFQTKIKNQLELLFNNADQQGIPLQYDPSFDSFQQIQYQSIPKQYINNNNEKMISDRKISFQFQYQQQQQQQQMKKQNHLQQEQVQYEIKQIYSINLNQIYIDDMQSPLKNILQNPTYEVNFQKFIQKTLQLIITYKKQKQLQQIQITIKQTSKVIYIMYNHDFMQFQKISQDNNIMLYILRNIVSQWRLNTFKCQIYKKIIKNMIQMFPIVQFSLWKVFLENFKRGPSNHKDVFQWLFQKDKQGVAIQILSKFMGSNISSLKNNANSYSIWI